jgi:hypothetical protein
MSEKTKSLPDISSGQAHTFRNIIPHLSLQQSFYLMLANAMMYNFPCIFRFQNG